MRFTTTFRKSKGAILVTIVLGVAALATFGAAQAANGPKPGADALRATAGVAAGDNTGSAKPGIAAAARTSAPASKAGSAGASPDLNGYVVVSEEFVNPAGAQSFGEVDCPAGKVAFGGGVLGNSFSLFQNVNSSYPAVSGGVAVGWKGYVDNGSGDDSVFLVYAVCAKKPAHYAVVSATFDNPTGMQTSAAVACPTASNGTQMKPFGGGAFSTSPALGQDINTTIPSKRTRSWRTDMNNGTGTDESFTVYAVCGLKAGWKVIQGPAVTNPANDQTSASVSCPAGLVSVGGGLYSSSGNTAVNLNGTYPNTSSSWLSYENNATAGNQTITPYVVCLA